MRTFLTTEEAASFLGEAPTTLRAWRREGIGPRPGMLQGFVVYEADTLALYLKRSRPIDQRLAAPAPKLRAAG